MIIVKMKCFYPNGCSYMDNLACSLYRNLDEAWEAALKMAEDESESLNDGADDGVSFGVVEDEEKNIVRVNYYYNEHNDTTGNTKTVTEYLFEETE